MANTVDTDKLLRQAQTHGLLRRVFLVAQAVAYIGWIGTQGLEQVHLFDPAPLRLIERVCWPIWLVSLLATCWLMWRAAKNRRMAALLDDERTAKLMGTVFQTSYWVLLVAVALVYGATFLAALDIKAVLPILLSLGVAVPGLTYAFLFRD